MDEVIMIKGIKGLLKAFNLNLSIRMLQYKIV